MRCKLKPWCANYVCYVAHMAFCPISLWTTKMSSGTSHNKYLDILQAYLSWKIWVQCKSSIHIIFAKSKILLYHHPLLITIGLPDTGVLNWIELSLFLNRSKIYFLNRSKIYRRFIFCESVEGQIEMFLGGSNCNLCILQSFPIHSSALRFSTHRPFCFRKCASEQRSDTTMSVTWCHPLNIEQCSKERKLAFRVCFQIQTVGKYTRVFLRDALFLQNKVFESSNAKPSQIDPRSNAWKMAQ